MPLQHLSILAHALSARLRTGDDERGAGLVEYLLLFAFIAVVVIVVVQSFGGKVSTMYSSANSQIP